MRPAAGPQSARGRAVFVLGALFILFYIMQIVNERFWMHDFEVYWSASREFLAGRDAYGPSFGLSTGVYKYAPAFLVLMIPLAVLPFFVAKTIFFFSIATGIIAVLLLSESLLRPFVAAGAPGSVDQGAILFTTLAVGIHLYRELHLGNINILLLLALLTSLRCLLRRREIPGGAILGGVIVLKPHFVVLLPFLVLKGRWRALFAAIGSIAVGILLPMALQGPAKGQELLSAWIDIVREHNASLMGPNTLYAWVHKCGGRLLMPDGDLRFCMAVAALAGLSYLGLWFQRTVSRKHLDADTAVRAGSFDFLFEFCLAVAVVPLLTLTDTEHFLLAMPLVMLLILHVRGRFARPLLTGAVIAVLILFGANSRDLLGRPLSNWWDRSGILGLAAMLLIGLGIAVSGRIRRGWVDASAIPTPIR